jgi:RNA polymerase sigma-70 factor (ECF subfamily)
VTKPDTDELIRQVARGEPTARDELFARHRNRLRRMIEVRMDRRVMRRVDPSDVIQEALIEANRQLPDYVQRRPVSFYPWLRRIAWKSLARLHRTHAQTGKRNVGKEVDIGLPDDSVMALAKLVVAPVSKVDKKAVRQEMFTRVRIALDQMKQQDREVLIMRYLEELTLREIAESIGISEAAVKMRQARSLQRLNRILSDDSNM